MFLFFVVSFSFLFALTFKVYSVHHAPSSNTTQLNSTQQENEILLTMKTTWTWFSCALWWWFWIHIWVGGAIEYLQESCRKTRHCVSTWFIRLDLVWLWCKKVQFFLDSISRNAIGWSRTLFDLRNPSLIGNRVLHRRRFAELAPCASSNHLQNDFLKSTSEVLFLWILLLRFNRE